MQNIKFQFYESLINKKKNTYIFIIKKKSNYKIKNIFKYYFYYVVF